MDNNMTNIVHVTFKNPEIYFCFYCEYLSHCEISSDESLPRCYFSVKKY